MEAGRIQGAKDGAIEFVGEVALGMLSVDGAE